MGQSLSVDPDPPRGKGSGKTDATHRIVFLVDVDNTLLDNDRIQQDIKTHLAQEYGAACRDRYWAILENLFTELGYRDYLGALQRYRVEHPQDMHLLSMSSFLVDYPFADRLYPGALDVLALLRGWGPTVLLTDGDVVFQPRKVEQSGLSASTRSWRSTMSRRAIRRIITFWWTTSHGFSPR
jgi:FMN phosphatase YigB (HAD superfamily)